MQKSVCGKFPPIQQPITHLMLHLIILLLLQRIPETGIKFDPFDSQARGNKIAAND